MKISICSFGIGCWIWWALKNLIRNINHNSHLKNRIWLLVDWFLGNFGVIFGGDFWGDSGTILGGDSGAIWVHKNLPSVWRSRSACWWTNIHQFAEIHWFIGTIVKSFGAITFIFGTSEGVIIIVLSTWITSSCATPT